MAFNKNGHFQISKNVELFIKWDNFLKKVDTESVLYTCCVANERSIFSSLILIFCETLWLLGGSVLLFFSGTSQIHIYKISFFTRNKVILNNSFFGRYFYVKTFPTGNVKYCGSNE